MDEKMKEIGDRLKTRLRAGEIGTASCKILTEGNNCNCSLCLVDRLLSLLSKKEKEIINKDSKIGILLQDITKEQNLTNEWHKIARGVESKLDEKEKEIQELKNDRKKYFDACRLREESLFSEVERRELAEVRVKDLKQGIGEVLDGTLPYLIEKRLRRLIENG